MQTSTSNWTILRIGIYGNIACPVGKYDMKSTVYGCFLSECMPMSIPVNTTPPALLSFGLPAREQMKKQILYWLISKRLLRPVYGKVIFIYPSFKQTCDESVNWISTPKTTSTLFSDALSFYLRKLISDTYADNASDTSNRARFSIG